MPITITLTLANDANAVRVGTALCRTWGFNPADAIPEQPFVAELEFIKDKMIEQVKEVVMQYEATELKRASVAAVEEAITANNIDVDTNLEIL